jgi:hypothetical protein
VVVELNKLTVAPLHASLAVGAANTGVAVQSMVAFAPCPPIVGGWLSANVIAWLTVTDVLPQSSIAFHVLVIVLRHELPVVTSAPTCWTVTPLQASAAVGAVKFGVDVHSIVAFAPCPPIVGAEIPVPVIVCVTVALWLPQASVASQLCVMIFEQELLVVVELTRLTVAPPHASDAVGAVNDGVAVQSIVALGPAAPIVGACVSTNVMLCVLVAE